MISILLLAAALLQDPLPDLIKRLGDTELAVRDKAESDLVARGEAVIPELEKALKGAEPEVASRIQAVIGKLRWWDHVVWHRQRAINLDSGSVAWSIDASAFLYTPSVLLGRDVVVRTARGAIERLDQRDGTSRWKSEPGDVDADILIAGAFVIAVGTKKTDGLDVQTGRKIWSVPSESDARWIRVAGEKALVLPTAKGMTCLDPATGKELWSLDKPLRGGVALPNGEMVLALESTIRRVHKDGTLAWESEPLGKTGRMAQIERAGDYLITGSGWAADDHGTVCLDLKTGARKWSNAGKDLAGAAISPDGKTIYVGCNASLEGGELLVALDIATWEVRWTGKFGCDGLTLLPLADRVLVGSFDTISCNVELQCFSAKEGRQLWKADATGVQVDHSKYHQRASLEVRGDRVVLLGAASGGDFAECFNVETGATIFKWRSR